MNRKKIILVICDGLGDRPVVEFEGRTPLQEAHTPNLDKMAQNAIKGMMLPIGIGKAPGSAVAHLSIFGYDPDKYFTGRGCIEVSGLGMELKEGDVAFRGNFGTVNQDMIVMDRRAGRIETVAPLTESLDNMKIEDVTFRVKAGIAHRAGVILSGPGLSNAISDSDPHALNQKVLTVEPLDDSPEAKRTADIVNAFSKKAHTVLNDHEYNRKRVSEDKLPGNMLLLRGPGKYMSVPSFEERYGLRAACITGGGMYRGIGRYLGMETIDLPGVTGTKDSDLESKFSAALERLEDFDFIFIHIKASDNAGHDGNHIEKRDVIEKIDEAAGRLSEIDENTLVVFTGDHSTPCSLKEHSADPVPIMFHGYGIRPDGIGEFNEIACMRGGMGHIDGQDVIPAVLGMIGATVVIGS